MTEDQPAGLEPLAVLALYGAHDYTLASVLDGRCRHAAARRFLSCGERHLDWSGFADAVFRAAGVLAARGIGRGDRIAVMAPNSDAHAILLFAAARLGAVLAPINPDFGAAEAGYILRHAGVAAVVCSTGALPVVQEACRAIAPAPWVVTSDAAAPGVEHFGDLVHTYSGQTPAALGAADDPVVIIYSSGTTGFPKGVVHSQRTYLLTAEVHLGRTRLQPDGAVLCMLPFYHVNALFYSLGSAVAAGAKVVIAPRFSASEFWRTVAAAGITHTTIMMALAGILVARPRGEFVPDHRLRVVNGSGFNESTLRVFREEFGVPTIIEGYGMSEIPAAFGNPYFGPRKLSSMGKPAEHPDPGRAWMQVRLLDDARRDVAESEPGELAVRVPNRMLGYFHDEAQTAEAFHDGWFLTGDLVRRDADGFYFFVGRKKDIIRRRGENISAAELDRVIGEHPAVADVGVIAVDAALGEDEIMAVVVRRPAAELSDQDVKDWCRERLAPHKVPKYVVFADALPHTSTHKVAKHLLRKDETLRALAGL